MIPPRQPVASSSKTVPPPPEPTAPTTPLFLGDSSPLPEIETLRVDESETDSAPRKKAKIEAADKGRAAKSTDAKHAIALCESRVLAVQSFCKDLEARTSQMMRFVGEQLGQLERVKRALDEV